MTALVRIRDLHKTYRRGPETVDVLRGIDLDIAQGDFLALMGPSGSGKTTLLNLLGGVYRPDTGHIRLADTDITTLPAWRRARLGIARSFQHAALADDMTALDNVAVAANAAWSRSARLADILRLGRDRRHASARQRAMAALVSVGAGLTATKRAADLGAAERQRVELARALAADPKVLLLDEPAAGLSEIEMHALQRLLRQVAARGIGIVVVDHGMPFLLPLADRVVCLDAGTVLASGAPREVAADPAVRAAYLGSASLQGAGG